MRIISGLYGGRTIDTVRDHSVRPATGRVRETVFNILSHRMDLSGIRVLDLFAGSGSLGLEALSREAARAVFVENSPSAVQYLRENVRSLGCEGEVEIVAMDSVVFLTQEQGEYDLVFADPPYGYERTKDLPGLIFSRKLVRQHGFLVIEHSPDCEFSDTSAYRVGPERHFGRTRVTFFRGISNNPEREP
ncbi:MAG: 16S rRNA (guanine(966)-N(2))-methyltransferase RsmD [Bacteroidota bacterium]